MSTRYFRTNGGAQEKIIHGGGHGCSLEKRKLRDDLIIVSSLSKCFGEEGEQLFSFLREEQEAAGLILQSVTFRLKARLGSEDFRWLAGRGQGRRNSARVRKPPEFSEFRWPSRCRHV